MAKRYTEEQIVAVLREAEVGIKTEEIAVSTDRSYFWIEYPYFLSRCSD